MRRVGLLRVRVAVLGTCAVALALAVAGCGSTTASSNSAVTVAGTTLTIYAGEPPGSSGGQVATDVLDAEQLAWKQSVHTIGIYHLRFAPLVHGNEVSQNARDAISDKTAIAYLGEIVPGSTGVALQITNEVGLLQISPTDTSVYLTQSTPAVVGAPIHFYPAHASFHETFARVVPTTASEAKALVRQMQADHLSRLDVADDGSEYGMSVALEVRTDARAAGITVTSSASGADAVFYGATPSSAATTALNAAASTAPSAKLFAPSGLYDDIFVSRLSAAAQRNLTVSAPGFLPSSYNPAGTQFVSAFRSAYGRAPVPQAVFGYESMAALIAVLKAAGSHAASRTAVIDDFRALKNRASALGTYSIANGDTTIAPFVLARVVGGKLVPRTQG